MSDEKSQFSNKMKLDLDGNQGKRSYGILPKLFNMPHPETAKNSYNQTIDNYYNQRG